MNFKQKEWRFWSSNTNVLLVSIRRESNVTCACTALWAELRSHTLDLQEQEQQALKITAIETSGLNGVCVCVSVFFHWTCLRKNTTFSCLSGRSEKSPVMQAYMSPVQRDYSLNITETAQFFYFLFLPQISIKDPVLSHTHKHTLLPAFWFRQVRFFVLAEPKPSFFTWPKKNPTRSVWSERVSVGFFFGEQRIQFGTSATKRCLNRRLHLRVFVRRPHTRKKNVFQAQLERWKGHYGFIQRQQFCH